MPELPEVETVVQGLNNKIRGRKIVALWTDWPKYFRLSGGEKAFRRHVIGKKLLRVERRGKNILISLSDNHLLLVHQKLSGHLLYGRWKKNARPDKNSKTWEGQKWIPDPPRGALLDPMNRFIRLIFFLDNKKMLALSDLRRFAKVLCGPKEAILGLADIKNIGPEPLDKNFTLAKFKALFGVRRGAIKQVLMDQAFIAGIGNIYSDEILYLAKIHPLSRAEKLKGPQFEKIYRVMRKIFKKAVKVRGTSIDDFRDTAGTKGAYGQLLMVYQKNGQKCPKNHIIKRLKVGGRSAHFCSAEQVLYK
jgi:formamidopyrimidine-DNA glycosylase